MDEKERKVQKALGAYPTHMCACCGRTYPADEMYARINSNCDVLFYCHDCHRLPDYPIQCFHH